MEDGLILHGVDDDLGNKIIRQHLHQAHRGHKGEGEEIEKQWGLEIERCRGLKLKATKIEIGDEG
jgi:hypothetical protein